MYDITKSEIITKMFGRSKRSKVALKNISMSLAARGIHIVSSLLIVPLTINYINPVQYGIWLTLSSIIGWINCFDLGFENGFRNKFAEARAKGDNEMAKKYLSTTYFAVSTIVSAVFIAIFFINRYVDWSMTLRVDEQYKDELGKVFVILSFFLCMNMVMKLVCTMLTADQRVGLSQLIVSLGEVLSLLVIFVLSKVSEGSLMNLTIYYSSIPCIILLLTSLIVYSFTKYKEFVPRLSYINLSLVPKVMGLGLQFFAIYLSMLLIFQIINIVITREFGPESVTEYNIAFKYFSIVHVTINVIVVPFWSAFTEAYQSNGYSWMKSVIRRLEQLWFFSIIVLLIMLALSKQIYSLWIGDGVSIRFSLSVIVAIYMIFNNIAGIYLNLINGIGTIRVQLIVYLTCAMMSYPLMILSCRQFGLVGIIIVPTFVVFLQAILAKMQLIKLLNNNATGVWRK